MGTNFYLQRKINNDVKHEIITHLQDDDYEKVNEILSEYRPIHIGKRSCGWKFLWDCHNFRYYRPTKESLNDFLKSGQIFDEYGSKFSFDDFWNNEVKDYIDNGWDLKTYYEDVKEFPCYRHKPSQRELDDLGEYKDIVKPNSYGEFYIEELRFTVGEDFS